MGLDISVYEKIEFVRKRRDDDDWGEDEDLNFFENVEEFADRSDGLEPGLYKISGRTDGFSAGSYSGYNEWRAELARLVGTTPQALWKADDDGDLKARETPFYELIVFSDAEGFIGPKTCAKLAKDFAAFADKAAKNADPWFADKYKDWRAAFELAANGGAVQFH